MAASFEVYKDKIGEFHWKLVHTNGQIIAHSGDGYTTKVYAIHGINSVKDNISCAVIKDKSVLNL